MDQQKMGKISSKYRLKFNGTETESPCERFLNGNLVQTSFKFVQNILVKLTNAPFPYQQFKIFSRSLTVQAGT
jgi:hypothetical protein